MQFATNWGIPTFLEVLMDHGLTLPPETKNDPSTFFSIKFYSCLALAASVKFEPFF